MPEGRLFYAMTARLIRDKVKPHKRGLWLAQVIEIRDLPEFKR